MPPCRSGRSLHPVSQYSFDKSDFCLSSLGIHEDAGYPLHDDVVHDVCDCNTNPKTHETDIIKGQISETSIFDSQVLFSSFETK
jgi:hypothetical protein